MKRYRLGAVIAGQIIAAVILLLPLIWMYVAAFRPDIDIRGGAIWPRHWTWANFRALFAEDMLGRAFLNSTLVSGISAIIVTVASTLAAYGMTRFRLLAGRVTLGVVIVAQMVPALVVLVPLVVALRYVHLTDSLVGLTISYLTIGIPIAVLLLRSYLQDIPRSLEEAAMVDGCSQLAALRRVVLPLLRPAIVSVASFSFILAWGEYLVALSLITSDRNKTLPLLMQQLFELHTVDLGQVMAFGVIISFPVAVLFMFVQRHLIANLGVGGVKE